jgi:hypothetical protein
VIQAVPGRVFILMELQEDTQLINLFCLGVYLTKGGTEQLLKLQATKVHSKVITIGSKVGFMCGENVH